MELKEIHCAICDIYEAFDRHLNGGVDPVADLVADLVSILPPRGHAFHDLAVWQTMYRSAS
jgi:hypothetical protein